jgi:hypothetical protein
MARSHWVAFPRRLGVARAREGEMTQPTVDFPQRKLGVRLLNLIAPLIRLPFIRRQFVPRIKDSMVLPFQRVMNAE